MDNPADNLKTAPANGIHHRDTPSAGFTIPPSQARGSPPLAKPKHSTISEENEEQDDDQFDKPYGEDNTLSAEAQAHNISMFLCTGTSSTSDSGMYRPVAPVIQASSTSDSGMYRPVAPVIQVRIGK